MIGASVGEPQELGRIDGDQDKMNDKRERAQEIAIAALGYIAADPELLPRFLAITGIEPHSIREAAQEPGFLAGVLQFIAAHEPTLLAFAESAGVPPGAVLQAMRALPQGDDRYDAST
jgi:hypothetical protein